MRQDRLRERVSLRLSSRIEWIDAVQAIVDDLTLLAGFDEDARHSIALAVREALNNAVTHGNSGDTGKHVDVDFELTDEVFQVRVADQGNGFEPDGIPDPTLRENLLKPSGRGVHLMRSLMDEVDLSRADKAGGQIVMLKRRNRAGQEPPETPAGV